MKPFGAQAIGFASRAALSLALLATLSALPSVWRPALSLEQSRQRKEEVEQALVRGDGRKALDFLGELRQSFPENAQFVRMEADAHRFQGDWEAEAASWELFLHLAPRLGDACPRLSDVYQLLGEPHAARRAERLCAQIKPAP